MYPSGLLKSRLTHVQSNNSDIVGTVEKDKIGNEILTYSKNQYGKDAQYNIDELMSYINDYPNNLTEKSFSNDVLTDN